MNGDDSKQIGVLTEAVNNTKVAVDELKDDFKKLGETYVTKVEFTPVKNIVYGIMAAVGLGVLTAVLKLVFRS